MHDITREILDMPLRVRYHECDPQGVVFNAHYLAYADMACLESMKRLFGSYDQVAEQGVELVLAESQVRYLQPCRFDEELTVTVGVGKVGRTSLTLIYLMRRAEATVTVVSNRYVWVDANDFRPVPPPTSVRKAFTGDEMLTPASGTSTV
ncbi:acyl-CoA thioesterase [Nocardia brasiliensis]|uniref:acyl-CoA thioesterase n=1 Tax=Nocardia brasiliensis TaxID=37326 RepID=UPI0036710405